MKGGRTDGRTGGRADGRAGGRTAEQSRRPKKSNPKPSLVTKAIKKVLRARPPVRRSARTSAPEIISLLKKTYPDARCALHYRNAYELLCATILSAQCTDA